MFDVGEILFSGNVVRGMFQIVIKYPTATQKCFSWVLCRALALYAHSRARCGRRSGPGAPEDDIVDSWQKIVPRWYRDDSATPAIFSRQICIARERSFILHPDF